MNLIWHTTPTPKKYGAIRRCLIFKNDKWNGAIGIQIVECGTKSDRHEKNKDKKREREIEVEGIPVGFFTI